MKILIDIGHPAHVHYYKNLIRLMEQRGHTFLIIARDRECIQDLLKSEKIKYINRGKGANTLIGKLLYAIKADLLLLYFALHFKPDLFLSHGSHYCAHAAFLLKKICICTGDSDHIKVNAKILIPYITALLTPNSYHLDYGDKHIFYRSYTELLYLHPNYFSSDNGILSKLSIFENEIYFVVRFISWNAFHDSGEEGFSPTTKLKIIQKLSQYGKIIISSEGILPQDLKKYQINFPANELHNLLAHASLVISEGATTASEAAVLGTPAIYINPLKVGYCTEQQDKYGLSYIFHNETGLLQKLEELLENVNLKNEHRKHREKMLNEKIDPTKFMIWFIEDYPESHRIAKADTTFQERFK